MREYFARFVEKRTGIKEEGYVIYDYIVNSVLWISSIGALVFIGFAEGFILANSGYITPISMLNDFKATSGGFFIWFEIGLSIVPILLLEFSSRSVFTLRLKIKELKKKYSKKELFEENYNGLESDYDLTRED